MNHARRTSGLAPALAALATFALLSTATLLRVESEPTVEVWSAVPRSWRDGLAQLRNGEAAAALPQLSAAEAECGVAPPALLRARLHAAALAGDWIDAELTAEKLALRAGDRDAAALRDFVVGLAEYARSARAGFEAEQPGADPTAFDRAIRHATAAALAFQAACLAGDVGTEPPARRNAERAALRRTQLQRKKEQTERERRRAQDRPAPEPDPTELEQIEQELQRAADPGLLSPAELQALLQRLGQAEDEKRSLRRAARSRRSIDVERDW